MDPAKLSLAEAKAWLRDAFKRDIPTNCPCCNQLVKRYYRNLSAGMAVGLIILAQHDLAHPGEWVHMERLFAQWRNLPPTTVAGGDVAKLKYWGLIEPKTGTREDGSPRVGFYRITDLGRDFVFQGAVVPAQVVLYDGKFLCYRGERLIGIREALGSKFDYQQLMRGAAG